ILTANSATNANTGNSADTMRSRTEPFIRRDQYAARAPTNGSPRFGMAMNWNLVLSKGNQMSTHWNPNNNRQDAAPGNHTFLICQSMEVSSASLTSAQRAHDGALPSTRVPSTAFRRRSGRAGRRSVLGVGEVHAVECDGDPADVSSGPRFYEA